MMSSLLPTLPGWYVENFNEIPAATVAAAFIARLLVRGENRASGTEWPV